MRTPEHFAQQSYNSYLYMAAQCMAIAYPPILSPAFPDSPTLPDFSAYPPRGNNAKYTTALEAEHSRELYLQGAMAVGQIARLLEELCIGIYDGDDGADEGSAGELVTRPSDVVCFNQFLSHEKRDQINAWAHGVSPDGDINLNSSQPCDVDIIDLEDADTTYLRGAYVVGDIADLLEELVTSLSDKGPENYEAIPPCSPQQIAPQLCDSSRMRPDAEFEARMNKLSARLAQLEMDIQEFSRERNDALKQMELDDAAQDKGHPGCSQDNIRHVERSEPLVDALHIGGVLGSEESPLITRVWTTTDTATSGLSLVTPAESEVQPLHFTSVKDYFWCENS